MSYPPPIDDSNEDRHNLYEIWKTTGRPKPPWGTFKRLAGVTRGDIKKALDYFKQENITIF